MSWATIVFSTGRRADLARGIQVTCDVLRDPFGEHRKQGGLVAAQSGRIWKRGSGGVA